MMRRTRSGHEARKNYKRKHTLKQRSLPGLGQKER